MLGGNFSCTGCNETATFEELRVCSGCQEILCSICRFSTCGGSVGKEIFHKTRKLAMIMKGLSKNIDVNEGNEDSGRLETAAESEDLSSGPIDSFSIKAKQLRVCAAAVEEAVHKNEERKKKILIEIKTAINILALKFARMLSIQEKKLQDKLYSLCDKRSEQLQSILRNVSVLDLLMKLREEHSAKKNDSNESRHWNAEWEYISRLDIMKLMLSLGNAVEGKVRFKTLSESNMKKALNTLPDIGFVYVQKEENDPENFMGMGENCLFVKPIQDLGKQSTEEGEDGRQLSEDDSIGETDRDFGEYHIGKTLVKILPDQRAKATYAQGNVVIDNDVTIHDEATMPVIKASHPQIKPNLLQRIPNAFRKSVFSNFSNRPVSPVKSRPPMNIRGIKGVNHVMQSNDNEKKSDKETEDTSASVERDEFQLPTTQKQQENGNHRRKRFLGKYSAKIEPNIFEQVSSSANGDGAAGLSKNDVIKVAPVSSRSAHSSETAFHVDVEKSEKLGSRNTWGHARSKTKTSHRQENASEAQHQLLPKTGAENLPNGEVVSQAVANVPHNSNTDKRPARRRRNNLQAAGFSGTNFRELRTTTL